MKTITILKPLRTDEFFLGKYATLIIANASSPLINFLRKKYEKDNTCIEGDIDFLFEHENHEEEIDKDEVYYSHLDLLLTLWNGKRTKNGLDKYKIDRSNEYL